MTGDDAQVQKRRLPWEDENSLDRHNTLETSFDGTSQVHSDRSISQQPPSLEPTTANGDMEADSLDSPQPRTRPRSSSMSTQPASPPTLRRELKSIHTFMISIGAVIGMGFYIRTGAIEAVGGSGAVVYSYAFLAILSWMVMRGISTMLHIWPISGALVVLVEKFVDEEVGRTVGVLYWLSMCFSFASLATTIGGLVDYLQLTEGRKQTITFFSLLLPIMANLTDIRYFRTLEVCMGCLKLILVPAIILIMNIINTEVGDKIKDTSNQTNLDRTGVIFHQQTGAPAGWFGAIMTSIFLASFSFVGIEVVAATAQEVVHSDLSSGATQSEDTSSIFDVPEHQKTGRQNPFKRPATMVPLVSGAAYLWGGWIVSQNIAWNDPRLPSLAFGYEPKDNSTSASIFVNASRDRSGTWANAVTVLLILNVLASTSTALYVALRTLFGLANTMVEDPQNPKLLAWLGKKFSSKSKKFDVPYVAVLASSIWVFFLPWLKYTSHTSYNIAVNIITEMGSVCCILV